MKKVLALVLAAVMVMALCGVAFAAATDDVNIKITGIKEGNTLHLYKLFSAEIDTNNTIKYTNTAAVTLPEDYDTIAEIAALSSSDDVEAMAKALANAFSGVAGTYTAVAGSGDYAQTDVAPGYYYAIVKGTADTGVVYKPMLINVVPVPNNTNGYDAHADIDQEFKKTPVTILKQEEKSPTDETLVKTTDGYCIGDNIDFVITTIIPNYPSNSKYATVVITDTPTGLVDNITSGFVVEVGGTAITTTNYDLTRKTDTDEVGFKLVLKDKQFILDNAGKSLVVKYKAQLVGPAHVTTNTADLTYNPNPYEDTTVTPPDTTDQKTYGFVFNKTDASDNGLSGATFALFDAAGTTAITDKDGTALTFTTTKNDTTNKAYVWWEGLAAGTYTVKETNAPAGYTPVADFTVTLSSTVCTEDNPATDTTEDYYLVITDNVVNNPGSTLPSTGGIGTTIFYVSGLIMVLGASIILISRRRAEAK